MYSQTSLGPSSAHSQPMTIRSQGVRKERWTKRIYLVYNPLSKYYTRRALEKSSHLALLPGRYVLGMAGFMLALPVRVAIFVKELFHMIFTLARSVLHSKQLGEIRISSERPLCLLGAVGELFSGFVGVLCPPVAYVLDEFIQENKVIHAHSFFGEWKEAKEEVICSPVPKRSFYTHKSQLLQPMHQQFKDAAQAMSGYMEHNDSALILKQIILIGLLDALSKDENALFLDPMKAYQRKYLPGLNLEEHLKSYKSKWAIFKLYNYSHIELIGQLISRAISEVAISDELSDNPDFESLYQALSNICGEMLQNDEELERLISEKAELCVPNGWLARLHYRWVHLGSNPEDFNTFN